MAGKKHERTRARRAAIQVLYTSEITGETATSIAEGDDVLVEDGEFPAYALQLVRGIDAHKPLIDRQLSASSENWTLSRMPIIDRSILRLATYEMLFVKDVPVSVSINEAVELAKEFGGEDDSSRFVNGVLGRIARQLEGGEGPKVGVWDTPEPKAEPAEEDADEKEPSAEAGPAASAEEPVEGGPAAADGAAAQDEASAGDAPKPDVEPEEA